MLDVTNLDTEIRQKYKNLINYLKDLGSVAVAFSGGVDSTFLLMAARDALGDRAAAITAVINSFPERERKQALQFCTDENIQAYLCEMNELEIEGFADNPPNRCYICKKAIFTKIMDIAKEQGFEYVAEGSNTDDDGDYRPGHIAIKELGVLSPLHANDLSKDDIRRLSKAMGLKTWDKPSLACLSSRFVYGEKITMEKLRMIDRAEQLLFDLGITQARVRMHGMLARIELKPSEFHIILENDNAKRINDELKSLGFSYVALDFGGYRTGSMNDAIKEDKSI
ncbi:MAG: ATP-dependent sacrificial sulfur transferase LarE [Lachnospiraceae bacterium]|nr:ATP-dependent sacrificial sulfur transferase LarE [Lachnospiraceae bacterium]